MQLRCRDTLHWAEMMLKLSSSSSRKYSSVCSKRSDSSTKQPFRMCKVTRDEREGQGRDREDSGMETIEYATLPSPAQGPAAVNTRHQDMVLAKLSHSREL